VAGAHRALPPPDGAPVRARAERRAATVDLERELDAGFELEARGWKGHERSAISSSPATERFYRSLAADLSGSGELRLSALRLDSRLAAFDLAFEHGGRLYSLKTAFDEKLRKLVPGPRAAAVDRRELLERGLVAHELLGDEMDWKLGFATAARDCDTVHLFSRAATGRAESACRRRLRPALVDLARRPRLLPLLNEARRRLR
jgi:CelD/BcsL family acetyltransferase involved in cellulose biosynthesis